MSNQATEQRTNQLEAQAAESVVILIEISEAQSKALHMMDKLTTRDALAKSQVSARIKSDFKAFREKQKQAAELLYDDASRNGFKQALEKSVWVEAKLKESESIWTNLLLGK